VMDSNAVQIDAFVKRVLSKQVRQVGMVGLAFKPGTDDMRESPYVKVAKLLTGEGVSLKIYDPGIQPERLIGANKAMVQQALGHLEELLVADLDALDETQLILINHPRVDAARVHRWLRSGVSVIDLVGIADVDREEELYEGIAW